MTTPRITTAILKDQHVWFFALIGILLTLFALYVYFLASSVFEVVMRKEIEREVVMASSYVGELEARYAALQYSVSAQGALERGYVLADQKIFIDRTDVSVAYSRPLGE